MIIQTTLAHSLACSAAMVLHTVLALAALAGLGGPGAPAAPACYARED